MSLEIAFKRLTIRPSSLCRQCRRNFASSARRPEQQSATASMFADLTQKNQENDTQNFATPDQAAPAPPQSSWADIAASAVRQSTASRTESDNRKALAELQRRVSTSDLERQMPRQWRQGDVYAPHDLSGVEASKWKKSRKQPRTKYDVLDRLRINPIHHYKNFSMMSEYMTEMGRIRHSSETGLRPVNQRKMAKAIRRAVGTGLLMPGTHRHPELIRLDQQARKPI